MVAVIPAPLGIFPIPIFDLRVPSCPSWLTPLSFAFCQRPTTDGQRPARYSLLPVLLLIFAITLACAPRCAAQAPFVTDDAEVADYHKLHFETNNEYDVLQPDAFPNRRQNTANFKFSYGLFRNIEVGADNQLLTIINAPHPQLPRAAFGIGDLDMSVKWHFFHAPEHSLLPDLCASFNLEVPTGDSRRQLGSGITDYYLNGIAQRKLTDKTVLHANGGIYFAGNTQTGVVGLTTHSGFVYTGGVSLVRDFTQRLDLGAELFGAVNHNFDLGRGQLQTQFGGNYKLREKLSLDFGLIVGFYQASPRVGPIIGLSIDF